MSGTPDEAEVQTMIRNFVDILEKHRAYADGTAQDGGELNVLEVSLLGEYAPSELTNVALSFRAGLSDLASPGLALAGFQPLLREYMKLLTEGSGYTDLGRMMRALYEHFVKNDLTVASREITYDSSVTAIRWPSGDGNVGNGGLVRLTEDENGFDLEFCTVETKRFRCRRDQNSGVNLKEAEQFEILGDPQSYDNLLRSQSTEAELGGSGTDSSQLFSAKHAGTGSGIGGSKLKNSSFSTFNDGTEDERFAGWAQTYAGSGADGNVTQDKTNTYRGSPGVTPANDASLKLTVATSGTVTMKQTLAVMGLSTLDMETPYFCRLMVNVDIGAAAGGTVTLRCGSKTAAATLAALDSNDWVELRIGDEALAGSEDASDSWPRNFNEADFDIELEWTGGTTGYILIDDVIFTPWDLIDGTYAAIRAIHATAPAAWQVDDTLAVTDTGGAPNTAKIQWWFVQSGLGYLPHTTGTETFTEP